MMTSNEENTAGNSNKDAGKGVASLMTSVLVSLRTVIQDEV